MKRFYILWLYAVTLTAFAAASIQSMIEERRLLDDSVSRTAAVALTIEESILSNYRAKRFDRIAKTVERLGQRQNVSGLAICGSSKSVAFPSGGKWESLCRGAHLRPESSWIASRDSRKYQHYVHALGPSPNSLKLVIAHDISSIRERWLDSFLRTLAVAWIGGVALLLLIMTQIRGWVKQNVRILHGNLKSILAGRRPREWFAENRTVPDDLRPLSRDLSQLAAKILAMPDRKARANQSSDWLASLRDSMGDRKLVVVANREPYIHQRDGENIRVVRPASGLVTALEPILRHCGGLWIGHGSGSADRETSDSNGEVAVPPNKPTYKLRRVWLTPEEEAGYYYGFANEGFWPLCHLAHNRPIFRLSDWGYYQSVNRKFSDAIPQTSLGDDSLVLVQDYHFALAPRMIKEKAGQNGAKVGLFWHIPWPNPEAFGICPWYKELLHGMLGADVIGFHTQYHCNNFLETCNRYLEARIDQERFSVTMGSHETLVRAFPIGIATQPVRYLSDTERVELKARYGIKAPFVAVGVDRLDYTKGLVERIESVERFLEKYPQYVGKFSLVQMGSPSRSTIPAYRALSQQLETIVERVNSRFGDPASGYQPVIFLATHHEWEEIQYFYQLGDTCMVTSLHDGMNLVAKEYVWCQRADRGSLILSKFTGASRELTDALIINPYSTEEMADALATALSMSAEERERRMTTMKQRVESRNAFQWASSLIQALITPKGDEGAAVPPAEQGRPGMLTSITGGKEKSASPKKGAQAGSRAEPTFH